MYINILNSLLTCFSHPPDQQCSSVWIQSVCPPPPDVSGALQAGSPWLGELPSGRTRGTVTPSPSGLTGIESSDYPPAFSSSVPPLKLK